ncbi:hypothetical protein [Streptomyces cylindrosporus]|uniref:WD40 repeat domain-containing protein n=1 Tax=Streptomyces cylindrosporus TaxID=2927583 RepID=A0ABS9Y9C0_9ACTN|nr:hypothetical protein [Streptomyces cylindrosporus]MCI3273829.1 hypothetical protein [Streptomyces cylindrosporus]
MNTPLTTYSFLFPVSAIFFLYRESVSCFVVLTRAWPRFVLARWWLAARGRLPWRLLSFLADARQREILRQSGGTYPFRHIRLQEALAGQPAHRAHGRSVPTPQAREPERVRRRVVMVAGLAAVFAGTGAALAHHRDQSRTIFADPDGWPASAVAFRPGVAGYELVWVAGDLRIWCGSVLPGGRLPARPDYLGETVSDVSALAFDRHGKFLAVGREKHIQLWSVGPGPVTLRASWKLKTAQSFTFHPKGGYLAGEYSWTGESSNYDGYFVCRYGVDGQRQGELTVGVAGGPVVAYRAPEFKEHGQQLFLASE